MSKDNMKNKKSKNKYNNDNKYNAENEIIIGVTTKPKEKVRAEKETARTNKKNKTSIKQNKNTGQAKGKTSKSTANKMKEKEIKIINRKKMILSIITLLSIIIAAGIYFLTTPVFNITSIEVYGNNKNSADMYINLSEINLNQTNIFAFTKGNLESKLKVNPYVEKIEIKRILPNILKINITERNIEYQAKYLNSYIYLDKQGNILEINETKHEVPIIEGLSSVTEDIQEGKRLKNEDLLKLDTILKIVNYLKYNNISESRLTAINAKDITNYILEFKEENKIVYLGDSSSMTEKMTAVTKILEAEKGKEGKIYANEDALRRNRIYFREEK